jgi:hypothetical protein
MDRTYVLCQDTAGNKPTAGITPSLSHTTLQYVYGLLVSTEPLGDTDR